MIKIEFQDKTFRIPSQWADVQLADYEQWFDQKPDNQRDYVHFVSQICGIDENLLLESPTQLFDVINKAVSFVFDADVPPSNTVEIGGRQYFVSLSDEITLGEWVDIESIIGGESKTKISDILSIVCRQAGEAYDAKLADERKAMFRQLSCDKALPLLSFFLYKKRESEAILNHYSELLAQADQFLKDTKSFAANGGGIKLLPIWQRIRYTYLTKSLEKQLSKCSASFSTK